HSGMATARVMIGLTDQPRYVHEQTVGVVHEPLQHPGPGEHHHQQGHDQTWQKAQGLLVDLGRGLKHADNQTDQQARQDDDADDENDQKQRIAEDIDSNFRGHGVSSSPVCARRHNRRYMPKLAARVPIIKAQPSTSTNNMILNGSEMIMGDSIIIPMAIRTLATTRSMMRKGMNSRKPI